MRPDTLRSSQMNTSGTTAKKLISKNACRKAAIASAASSPILQPQIGIVRFTKNSLIVLAAGMNPIIRALYFLGLAGLRRLKRERLRRELWGQILDEATSIQTESRLPR